MKKIYHFRSVLTARFAAAVKLMIILFVTLSLRGYSQNAIFTENQLPGNLPAEWDIVGRGDLNLQGFATQISVNKGETVNFKIKSDAAYTVDIYRLGWYNGDGARKVSSIGNPVVFDATLPQTQPADNYYPATGITDCSNWSLSAHWAVPSGAVSGLYIAKLTRTVGQGASHIVFIVRDDAANSDILFKTADATWQAYNRYGGNNFYYESAGTDVVGFNHAVKASYNRPFYNRDGTAEWGSAAGNWIFNAEYPMIRWLERNGYDVTYTTHVDMSIGNLNIGPADHRILLSVGHDEYWSDIARANFETARNNGVHLAFFSGNEVYWKTRWEYDEIPGVPVLVCYKEGNMGENYCGFKCDPDPVWTGLWRAPALPPASDGGRPENALSGQISWYLHTGPIDVPAEYSNLRFWRNTAVASLQSGQTLSLPEGTLGYEMDWEQYFDHYPDGRITMSSTLVDGQTHKLSLYRHSSGALVFGAGTVQWAWGLDDMHDNATGFSNEPPSSVMQQATLNLLADMGVQPESIQAGLQVATASTDLAPPVSAIIYPTEGSTVPNTTLVITGTAQDADGVVAGVEVSVDGGLTWQMATGRDAWSFSWTPISQHGATIMSRAFDDSGNIESLFTAANTKNITVAPPECPCTIWAPSTIPGNLSDPDPSPVEVGVRFRSNTDGYITGIRFYKSPLNTGTHTGNLWNESGGTALASAIFTNETASGWQEVTFSSPVAITANTNYIASYHTTSGHYSFDENYFALSGYSSFYLTALQNTVGARNGLYRYLPNSTFPTDSYNATNYWVDVVFTTITPDDVTPPVVTSVSPANGASGIVPAIHPSALFSEELNPLTVTTASVLMTGPGDVPVSGSVSYSARTITFVPDVPLTYHATYRMILVGGTGSEAISDLAGNKLAANFEWSFRVATSPPPPPDQGAGGPILVISSPANPFSRYYVEILRAEGLNGFYALDFTDVTPAVLANYDVAILGNFAITDQFAADLTSWVGDGGTLVAMRPDTRLDALLGINRQGGTLAESYLLVNTSEGPGVGIVDETIQFHSQADLYTLNGATSLATLYSDAYTPMTNPAVTMREVGSNGGKAVAFAYDLARSIVYTRQGNPAWAGQKRDGTVGPIRSDDLFFPDWIDLNKVSIPQADEQQRFLANIIIKGALHKKPLPRFWFLPKGLKAAVVMTGDNHGDTGMRTRFDYEISISPTGCSFDDWECIRSTAYFYPGTTFTSAEAVYYSNLGFEIALHINTECLGYNAQEFQSFITDQMGTFTSTYPGIPIPTSNRNHCIAWPDWSTTAEVEAANGIRIDANYYYWPNTWHGNRPGMFTGSGTPMRFAKTDGTLIDAYQVATQMQDEEESIPVTPYPEYIDALLDKALGQEGYYGVFCANMHYDLPDNPGAVLIRESAISRGIPVITARQILEWLDGRNSSFFGPISWTDNNTLSFTITAGDGANNLRAMLPVFSETGEITGITRSGTPVPFSREVIKGIDYAFFSATDGSFVATYSVGNVAPVVVVHPQDVTTCEGSVATFTSSAEGVPAPAVSWEESPDGSTWTPIPDVATGTLTIPATTANNDHRYRAVWENAAGEITSNVARLTVTAPLTATIEAVDNSICEGVSVQLRLAASTGQAPWFLEVDGVIYRADNIGDVFATLTLQGYSPTVTYELTSIADGNGCSSAGVISSTTVSVERTPAGTISALQSPLYEGEEMNLIFTSTAGTGPFTLLINNINYPGIISGVPFPVGTAVYAPIPVPQTIWTENPSGLFTHGDPASYELGLKFTVTEPGTISAVRFYKTDSQVRSFTVSIWDVTTVTRIAGPVNYTSDGTPGWKQIDLGTPVSINSNTSYVASYFNPGGYNYAFTDNYVFPVVNGPLRAENCLYSYSTTYIPTYSTNANYWVDVVFNSTAGESGSTEFNLTSITSEADCSATGNPLSTATVGVTQARVWTGNSDSDWESTGNWSDGIVPEGENVVIPAEAVNFPAVNTAVVVNSLIISPDASMTVGSAGALTVSGDLNTTGGNLAISSTVEGSGSLIVRGNSTGEITYNRQFKTWPNWSSNNNFDWHLFSSPVADNTELNTGKVETVLRYSEVSNVWTNLGSSFTSFASGIGYNLDQTANTTSDELLSFTGSIVRLPFNVIASSPYLNPFDGTSYLNRPFVAGRDPDDGNDADGVYGGGGWNLLGNPFTSGLDVQSFISTNAASFDPNYLSLYVYDASIGDVGVYVITTTGSLQTGQGFFVLAMNNGVNFTFTPASVSSLNMQAHSTGTPILKSVGNKEKLPGVVLSVKHGNTVRETDVYYDSEMTTGLDPGYDIGQLSTNPSVEIYTTLAGSDNGVNFARQALPLEGAASIIVPIGIDSETGGDVTFSGVTVTTGDNGFWLEDRLTGVLTDLRQSTYTATLPPKTYGTGRFFLKASGTFTDPDLPEEPVQGLRIWTSNHKIIIKGEVSSIAVCEVYDMQGRKIVKNRLQSEELNTVDIPPSFKGFCFVKVTDGEKVTTQKIILL